MIRGCSTSFAASFRRIGSTPATWRWSVRKRAERFKLDPREAVRNVGDCELAWFEPGRPPGNVVHERVESKMKHVQVVTKSLPIRAFWWTWFGQFGELKSGGAASFKAAFVNALWNTDGTLDPR